MYSTTMAKRSTSGQARAVERFLASVPQENRHGSKETSSPTHRKRSEFTLRYPAETFRRLGLSGRISITIGAFAGSTRRRIGRLLPSGSSMRPCSRMPALTQRKRSPTSASRCVPLGLSPTQYVRMEPGIRPKSKRRPDRATAEATSSSVLVGSGGVTSEILRAHLARGAFRRDA